MLELLPNSGSSSVKGDLDSVGSQVEHAANLAGTEIGAVPQGQQILTALIEASNRRGKVDAVAPYESWATRYG